MSGDRDMELPSHPEVRDGRSHEPQKRTEWGTLVFGVVVAVLIVGLALLHLTGVVGPAGH